MRFLVARSKFFGNFKQYAEDDSNITSLFSNKILDIFRYHYFMNPPMYIHEALGNFRARMETLWGQEVKYPESLAWIHYASYSRINAVQIAETYVTVHE